MSCAYISPQVHPHNRATAFAVVNRLLMLPAFPEARADRQVSLARAAQKGFCVSATSRLQDRRPPAQAFPSGAHPVCAASGGRNDGRWSPLPPDTALHATMLGTQQAFRRKR
ncbi:hypothetical protein, partial [Nitritalea halalkaliphila]|uniref:hypothetical protein n=1 Tax=Nitritalea halalkaliphila TaxID=590849 RepID=UPI001EE68F84